MSKMKEAISPPTNGAAWRNRIIELRTVTAEELRANPLNWRTHPPGQAAAIKGVLAEVGIAAPLVAYYSERANGALTLIDGHMRLETGGQWPCAILDVSDAEADLLLATFDPIGAMAQASSGALDTLLREVRTGDAALQTMLAALAEESGLDYAALGGGGDDGAEYGAGADDLGEDEEDDYSAPSDGSLLKLVNVTIAEPTHTVERGDVWTIGPHVLACVEVLTGWPVWIAYLKEGVIFCPYPGPFVALSLKADTSPLVLVQPDPYIAGHILDRYAEVKGEQSVKRAQLAGEAVR